MRAFQIAIAVIVIAALGLAGFGVYQSTNVGSDLNSVKSDVSAINGDIATIQTDISALQAERAELESSLASVLQEVETLKQYPRQVTTFIVSLRATGDFTDIQPAIDALPREGGKIYIEEGLYTLHDPIVIAKDNVQLVGSGYSTILFLANNAQEPCIVVGDTKDGEKEDLDVHRNIIIRNLQIDGNMANQPPGTDAEYSLTRPWLRNNGITLRRVSNSVVERCLIQNCRSGGLVLEKGCSHNQIVEIRAYNNFFDGVCAYETTHCIFNSIDASNNGYAGFSFDLWSDENIIGNCIAVGNGHSGFFIAHSTKLTIFGCQFSDSSEYDGIFLSSGSSENIIANCYFKANKRYGVNIVDADCTKNLVHGCYFWYNEAGSINAVVGAEPYDYDNTKLES